VAYNYSCAAVCPGTQHRNTFRHRSSRGVSIGLCKSICNAQNQPRYNSVEDSGCGILLFRILPESRCHRRHLHHILCSSLSHVRNGLLGVDYTPFGDAWLCCPGCAHRAAGEMTTKGRKWTRGVSKASLYSSRTSLSRSFARSIIYTSLLCCPSNAFGKHIVRSRAL